MKKVSVVGIVGLPACYGGFETLVENLVDNVSDEIDYSVFCSTKSYSSRATRYGKAKLYYLPFNANGVSSIIYDSIALIKSCFLKVDVILVLGVSGCFLLPLIKVFSKAKIITNIDGLEWKREKWSKPARIFLKISERLAVRFSDIVVTDNEGITNYVKDEYSTLSHTIEYGGDHALVGKIACERECNIFNSDAYALSLCRIEPENNVDMILEAFSKIKLKLKFIGNWDSSEYGRQLKQQYSVFDNIDIIDPIYDLDALYEMRSDCVVYVHGHSAGGTNPSLVEMMHFGKPILAFDCVFNNYTTENKAIYFQSSSDLESCFNSKNMNIFSGVSQEMESIAKKRYTWKNIASKYEELYC